jgi:hypothetical protein
MMRVAPASEAAAGSEPPVMGARTEHGAWTAEHGAGGRAEAITAATGRARPGIGNGHPFSWGGLFLQCLFDH